MKNNLKEAIIGDKNDQLYVEMYPKNMKYKCDIIRLHFKSVEDKTIFIDMTPDEASEISAHLSTAVMFYILENDKTNTRLKKSAVKLRTKSK